MKAPENFWFASDEDFPGIFRKNPGNTCVAVSFLINLEA